MLQMLMGLYLAVRNPRHHEKVTDSVEDAFTLILFVNYLAKTISKGKGPFDIETFVKQVFDRHFTGTEKYADLLVQRIPDRKVWDVLLEVYRKSYRGDRDKLAYVFGALNKRLSPHQIDEFCAIVSEKLETTDDDDVVRLVLKSLPYDYWEKYTEVARMRTETKLIGAVRIGKYDKDQDKCISGCLGTFGSEMRRGFIQRNRLMVTLARKLESGDSSEADYVFEYFISTIHHDFPNAPVRLVVIVKRGLEAGDSRFRRAFAGVTSTIDIDDPWSVALANSIKAYDAEHPDDVPF